jgi:hypothetical protein
LRNERTAIVVLSDGDDNKSFVPFPSLLDSTRESGALIYPVYVPSGLIPANGSSIAKTMAGSEAALDPLRSRYLTVTSRADEGPQISERVGRLLPCDAPRRIAKGLR